MYVVEENPDSKLTQPTRERTIAGSRMGGSKRPPSRDSPPLSAPPNKKARKSVEVIVPPGSKSSQPTHSSSTALNRERDEPSVNLVQKLIQTAKVMKDLVRGTESGSTVEDSIEKLEIADQFGALNSVMPYIQTGILMQVCEREIESASKAQGVLMRFSMVGGERRPNVPSAMARAGDALDELVGDLKKAKEGLERAVKEEKQMER